LSKQQERSIMIVNTRLKHWKIVLADDPSGGITDGTLVLGVVVTVGAVFVVGIRGLPAC
jgi:hypothetical protein